MTTLIQKPVIELISDLKEIQDLRGLAAIALPISASNEGPVAMNSHILSAVEDQLEINITLELSLWPDFTAKAGEIIELPISILDHLKRIYLVGVGDGSPADLRKAGAVLGRKVKGNGFKVLDALLTQRDQVVLHCVALILSQYVWTMKSVKAGKESIRNTFQIFGKFEAELARAQILANAVCNARDLILTPSNTKSPAWLVTQARALIKKSGSADLSIKVLQGAQLAKFGGLRAVGNSSPKRGPRFIEVTYAPKGSKNWPLVVLVGKGITFDTGGINLKRPAETMLGMKTDMAGAAAILAAIVAIPEIAPRVRVTALMMCAENSISKSAQRPSDVITHYGGKTVEVLDTDAEGRLVLADGLAYADLELNPDFLIDVATLTGAARIGLGQQYSAMFTRDLKLAGKLHEIGNRIGDRVWHMPFVDDYSISLESAVADLSHIANKKKFGGGSITAALFLENFVGKRKWVHLDIAGTGRSDVDSGENVIGGTGSGTRLLIEWIASL